MRINIGYLTLGFLQKILAVSDVVMLKVAFVMDDSALGKYSSVSPENGNEGIGGTQYCFIALAYELTKSSMTIEPTLIHCNSEASLPNNLSAICVSEPEMKCNCNSVDFSAFDLIVARGDNAILQSWILNKGVPVVLWVHNHLKRHVLDAFGKNDLVQKVIFCGREQMALALDTKAAHKATYIYNMHYPLRQEYEINYASQIVVYIGNIIPSKGVHKLIRLWPMIKKEAPDARLKIIGSGQLYNQNAKLGRNGIAEAGYEKRIMKYLDFEPEKYDVEFLGLIRKDKYLHLASSSVAVPNPTGLTECCPGSVIECASVGLPVVSVNKFGMVDTVKDGSTGILTVSDKQMIQSIVALLHDPGLSEKMGRTGKEFVKETFAPSVVVSAWQSLISEIIAGHAHQSENKVNLRGRYAYSWLIKANHYGNKKLIGLLRDFISRIETAILKLR
ncbi:glycosyltransferase family 4 protein [Reinekea thalattae]|uniref:Glycosyltransferase family 4 protein n=1 Tax=Reinekea thalattae TaxID=2593301 RepID=A0A5C8Z6U1_9GAMM|nr:glycosyltransferase family 4 protein [Reinekea thalattae]TXR53347.1 glycosyltransferase family 4 protein [Reinekea thalattae]